MKVEDPRIAKLPVWAQKRIANAERQVAELSTRLIESEHGRSADPLDGPGLYLRRFIAGNVHYRLMPSIDSQVTFSVEDPDGGVYRIEVALNRKRSGLTIRCNDGYVAVVPEAANTIEVRPIER